MPSAPSNVAQMGEMPSRGPRRVSALYAKDIHSIALKREEKERERLASLNSQATVKPLSKGTPVTSDDTEGEERGVC